MAKPDGGPAFPTAPTKWEQLDVPPLPQSQGMSLRDHFAGQALVGFAMNIPTARPRDPTMSVWRTMADDAYALADAMIAKREKENGA
jgi:hypothetical protein